jgi:hypothetical protein
MLVKLTTGRDCEEARIANQSDQEQIVLNKLGIEIQRCVRKIKNPLMASKYIQT